VRSLPVLKRGGALILATDIKGPPKAIAEHGFSPSGEEQAKVLRGAGFAAVRLERHGRILDALAAKA
jgi:hypothetical protein